MASYGVELGKMVYGYYEVEGDTREEAITKAKELYNYNLGLEYDEVDDFTYIEAEEFEPIVIEGLKLED